MCGPALAMVWRLLIVALASWPPALVLAHAPPEVLSLTWSNSDQVILVSNRGFIVGDPSLGSWSLLCNEALGYRVTERPSLVLRPSGQMLIAASSGLKTSDDGGCTFSIVDMFSGVNVTSLIQASDDPDHLYLTAYATSIGGVYESTDGGAQWKRLLQLADNDFPYRLLVSESNPVIMHFTSTLFNNTGDFQYYIQSSNDAGETWRKSIVPMEADEVSLELLALHPTDVNVVIAKATRADPSIAMERLLISIDGGATFASTFSATQITGATFDPAGVLWVSSIQGLYVADDALETFTQTSQASEMTCVQRHGADLFGCGHYDGFDAVPNGRNGVGLWTAGAAFASWMDMTQVVAPLACPRLTVGYQSCISPWSDWTREIFGTTITTDGGTADAATLDAQVSVDAASTPPSTVNADDASQPADNAMPAQTSSGCGSCSVGSSHPPRHLLGFMVLCGAMIWQRRRFPVRR